MEDKEGRYWIRVLYGYELSTLAKIDNLEDAQMLFNRALKTMMEEPRPMPYMVFLVDALEDKVIIEKTVIPHPA